MGTEMISQPTPTKGRFLSFGFIVLIIGELIEKDHQEQGRRRVPTIDRPR